MGLKRIKKQVEIEPKWYVLKTKPRFEKKLHKLFKEIGYTSFLPLTKELKQWSDRKKWVEEPAIRGYVFVHTKPSNFDELLNIDGAVHFIKFNNEPAFVNEKEIDIIRKIVENKYRFEITNEKFAEGDKVKVVLGHLKGYTGEWIENRSKKQLVIRLWEHDKMVVELPASYVKKIDD